MTQSELVKALKKLDKPFYTIYDLKKITGIKSNSLYVSLNRWVKKEVLERASNGIYILKEGMLSIEKMANQLYMPSYLSFESALSKYGILNPIPYAVTFATLRKTKKIKLINRLVEFRQIKKEYFFGFVLRNGIYLAEPEKALLDMIYMNVIGKSSLDIEEMNLRLLSKKRLFLYAKKFPVSVEKKLFTYTTKCLLQAPG